MPWVKAAELKPTEGAQVLVYDGRERRMLLGRYAGGRWYVEDEAAGRLREVAGVTHWAPILDSYEARESEDD
jgi:hypothetical protein